MNASPPRMPWPLPLAQLVPARLHVQGWGGDRAWHSDGSAEGKEVRLSVKGTLWFGPTITHKSVIDVEEGTVPRW